MLCEAQALGVPIFQFVDLEFEIAFLDVAPQFAN
jgi:hypothetical protein